MRRDSRFVAYAFSVGDIFVELDGACRIVDIEGALSWIGLDDPAAVCGRPFEDLLAAEDRDAFAAAVRLCAGSGRCGPVRLAFGMTEPRRHRFAVFLAKLDPGDERYHLVAAAASRLYGMDGREQVGLIDAETFFERIPALIAGHGDGSGVSVSLFELMGSEPVSEASIVQNLAALSLGGTEAARLGEGRYAVLHDGGKDAAADLAASVHTATGQRLGAATLPAPAPGPDGADSGRALIYTIRKYAERAPGFELDSLTKDYERKLETTRRRIAHLRSIILERRFKLAYQPIVKLETGDVLHYEALVRFDMRGGSPYELITFAEETGLIDEFDAIIVGAVLKKLDRPGEVNSAPAIAANVSARSLSNAAFAETLCKHLEAQRRHAGRLLIEVTESARSPDLTSLAAALESIRGLGFRVCLDDFGAGASGFQYLRDLAVDIVKIDGSYIRSAETDPRARAFLHAIVTLCRDLGIETVGEWIETRSQADLLAEMGVDCGQGFLFGRPKLSLPKARESTGAGPPSDAGFASLSIRN